MALTPVLAKEFIIYFDGKAVTFAKDFNLELNKASVDVTKLNSDGWKEYLTDLKDWKISGSGMVTRGTVVGSQVGWEQLVSNLLTVDTAVTIAIKTVTLGDQYVTGSGFLTSVKQSGQIGDASSFSFEMLGTGALTIATVSS